jgi:hypothetical protein
MPNITSIENLRMASLPRTAPLSRTFVTLLLIVFCLSLLVGTSWAVPLGLETTSPLNIGIPVTQQALPSTFTLPVNADLNGQEILAFQFDVVYDPAVLIPTGRNFGCSSDGTLAGEAGMVVMCNEMPSGTLHVAVYGAYPMSGVGAALNLNFATAETARLGDSSALRMEDVFFFNVQGPVPVSATNGLVTLITPEISPTPTPPTIHASAPTMEQERGTTFSMPIAAAGVEGVIAYQFDLLYDEQTISPVGENFGCTLDGTVAGDAGMTVVCNVMPEGHMRAAVYGAYPIGSDGVVLYVTFVAMPAAEGKESPVAFSHVCFFDNFRLIPSETVDGAVMITAPAATPTPTATPTATPTFTPTATPTFTPTATPTAPPAPPSPGFGRKPQLH